MTALTRTEYQDLGAVQIAGLVQSGALSARDVTAAAIDTICERDPAVRAFTELWPGLARRRANDVDRRVRSGEHLALAGVPLAVKRTEGLDAVQTTRLIAAGCIPVGATSTPGRGTAWQTWGHTDRGPTLNPLGGRWSPGGSSAGSAAAVASSMVPLATGSDGAGSIRIPAAWCGIIGLKPTNGWVPARDRAGLNVGGPLARRAQDAAAYLDAVADAPARTSIDGPGRPLQVLWSSTLGFADTCDQVATAARARLDELERAGAVIVCDALVQLPDPAACWTAMRAGDDQVAAGLRSTLTRQIDEVFADYDLVATPTTPGPPHGHDGPGDAYSVSLTWAFNITGHPAVSLPAGYTPAGEPVGLQLVARAGHEGELLTVAHSATTSTIIRAVGAL